MVRSFLLSLARAPTRVRTLPAASFPPTIFERGRAERPFLPGLARALATPRATTALSIATWSQQLAARTPQGCCSSRRAASVEAERPLQVLPSEEFWGEVYDSLRDDGEAEGVTILTWHKRAREPVAVGETILEVDVAGVVLEMKASVAGFMGSRGAEEGAVVRPGEHAAEILREAEPEPVVSDATMSIEITNSEGSVATLQRALESIEDERKAARKDFVAACHLAAFHGLADGAGSTLVARVPGGAAGEACLYSVPWGMHYLEVSSDAIVMRDAEQIEEQGREPGVGEGAAAHIFRQAKGVNAVLIASPAHVSALALRCSSSGPGVDQDHFRRNLAGLVGLRQVSVVVGGWEGDAAALAAIASAEVEAAEDGVGVVLLGGAGVLVAAPSIGVCLMTLMDMERAARVLLLAGPVGLVDCGGAASVAGGVMTQRVARFRALVQLLQNTGVRRFPPL